MASPVDSNRVTTSVSTAATSHNINVGSPASGNLLIVMVRFSGDPGANVAFTGYSPLLTDYSDASDDLTCWFYRWADGTEGTTDTLTNGSSVKLAAICWVITGAENPATVLPHISQVVVGTAANVNPGAPLAADYSDTLDNASSGSSISVGGSAAPAPQMVAQSFIASGTTTLVRVFGAKLNSPTDNLLVEIQTDSSGLPSGTVIGTTITVSPAPMPANMSSVFEFPVNAATSSGTKYWIVFRRSVADTGLNRFTVKAVADVDAAITVATHDGTSWNADGTSRDLGFAVGLSSTLPSADYLFITMIGLDSETATATAPSGYANTAAANSGTGGAVATNCMIWGASKQATGSTGDDPAAWTSSAPNAGVTALTIAIPAPAAAAPGPSPGVLKPPLRRRASRFLTFR